MRSYRQMVPVLQKAGLLVLITATAGVAPDQTPASKIATQPATTQPVVPVAPVVPSVPAAPTAPAVTPAKHQPVPPPPPPTAPGPVAPPVTVATPVTPLPAAPTTQPVVTPAPVVPAPPAVAVPTTQPGLIDEKVAYAIGYSVGSRVRARLAEDGRGANDLQVLNGIIAGMDNRDPAYPREEMAQAFAQFQEYTLQRRAEKEYAEDPGFRKRADDNLQKSHALMAQNAEMAGVDSLSDGVQVQVIKAGTGAVLGNAKLLTVNLKVSLADGTLVKSTEPGKPQKISTVDCLPAVIDASRGMKVGSVWRILLPPNKAYGLAGKPPVIGPNEAIEYEIELLAAE